MDACEAVGVLGDSDLGDVDLSGARSRPPSICSGGCRDA